jgi:hypothetical protein
MFGLLLIMHIVAKHELKKLLSYAMIADTLQVLQQSNMKLIGSSVGVSFLVGLGLLVLVSAGLVLEWGCDCFIGFFWSSLWI